MVILIHGLFVPIRHVYSQQDNRIFCVLLNFFPLSALHFSSLWPWREYRAVTFPGPPQNFAFLLLSLFLSTSARVPGNDLVGPASDLCFPSSFLISFLLCKCTRKWSCRACLRSLKSFIFSYVFPPPHVSQEVILSGQPQIFAFFPFKSLPFILARFKRFVRASNICFSTFVLVALLFLFIEIWFINMESLCIAKMHSFFCRMLSPCLCLKCMHGTDASSGLEAFLPAISDPHKHYSCILCAKSCLCTSKYLQMTFMHARALNLIDAFQPSGRNHLLTP